MLIFHRKQKNFLECWDSFKHLFYERSILLFLDFDGTLVPIVEQPQLAFLSPEMKTLLQTLSSENLVTLTIVTGRSLEDIRHRVGIKKITYVANHGFEIEGPNVHFRSPLFPKTAQIYCEIEEKLRGILKEIPEIIFEDKGVTLSIHYRMVPEKKKDLIKRTVRRVVKPYTRFQEITLKEGKEVLEIRPAIAWDKGKAVLWLLHPSKKLLPQRSVIVYVGDDKTDEDAFKALSGQALTIQVGKPKISAAQYYLEDVEQVYDFLSRTAEVRKD